MTTETIIVGSPSTAKAGEPEVRALTPLLETKE